MGCITTEVAASDQAVTFWVKTGSLETTAAVRCASSFSRASNTSGSCSSLYSVSTCACTGPKGSLRDKHLLPPCKSALLQEKGTALQA